MAQGRGVATKVKDGITDRVPKADQVMSVVDVTMQKALAGLHTAFVERGLNSVSPAAIFRTFASEGVDVKTYEDVRKLDLKLCDRSVPRRKEKETCTGAASKIRARTEVLPLSRPIGWSVPKPPRPVRRARSLVLPTVSG